MRIISRKNLLLVGALVTLFASCGDPVTEVLVEKVGRHTIEETVSASGKIYPETEVTISPEISGEIIDIYFEEGDSVKEGDLLFTIRPDVYQSILEQAEAVVNQTKATLANANARLIQAQAQFENAKTTFDRNTKLYKEKVLSQADYDNALAAFKTAEGELKAAEESVKGAGYNVKSAEGALKEARDNLTKTKRYAPMAGIVSKLNKKEGETVLGTAQFKGDEILVISDLSKMEVRVDVSENDILRVSLNDTAEIEIDAYIDRKFKGLVRHIANSAKSSLLSGATEQVTNFEVKIAILPDSYKDLVSASSPFPFRPGLSATVEIKTDLIKDALSVPVKAVTIRESEDGSEDKKEIVFVHENGKAKAVEVKSGIQDSRYIQIKEGLTENQEAVTDPYTAISKTLKDGDEIKVVEKLSGKE